MTSLSTTHQRTRVGGGRPHHHVSADSGSHGDHHHFLSAGLVAAVEGNQVRLSANADNAALLEEEEGGGAIADRNE